uniref:Uncharacterized protein n=1 Tax=Myotis myotis TaxID=51298 RepID=A0A7J7ZYQ1_MYOMY|nr:hypothetical protein mMyoMyo1_009999 [Myotis myotis]
MTRNFTPRDLPRRSENTCPQKHEHMDAPSSFSHNSPKGEPTQCPLTGARRSKISHPHNATRQATERERTVGACNHIDASRKYHLSERHKHGRLYTVWPVSSKFEKTTEAGSRQWLPEVGGYLDWMHRGIKGIWVMEVSVLKLGHVGWL